MLRTCCSILYGLQSGIGRPSPGCLAIFFSGAFLVAITARGEPGVLGVSGDLGVGGLGGMAMTTLQSGIDIQEGNLSLGLFGRVRFYMQDPQEGGAIRSRDWDEVTDYVHILRYLRYIRTFENQTIGQVRLRAKAGEMLGYTLGHGTIIRDYSNIADPDHPHAGFTFHLLGKRWRADFMIDNFVNPTVIANRFSLVPVPRLKSLRVGSSLVFDPQAPVTIKHDQDKRRMDKAYNLQARTAPLVLMGLDVEYKWGNSMRGAVTPYLDLNTSIHGVGLHIGSLGEVPLLDTTPLRLVGQVEYRLSSPGYSGTYMGTFYDVERFQAGLTFTDPTAASADELSTKLAGLVRGNYGGHGVLAQAGIRLRQLVAFKIGVSVRPGPDSISLWWRGSTRPISRLQLGMLVLMRGLNGDHAVAGGVMAMAEGRFRITDTLYTLAQYIRSWSVKADTGYYGMLQAFNISIGASWSG